MLRDAYWEAIHDIDVSIERKLDFILDTDTDSEYRNEETLNAAKCEIEGLDAARRILIGKILYGTDAEREES